MGSIKARYRRMIAEVGAKPDTYPFFTEPRHDGSPHVEFIDGGWDWVVTERDQELERRHFNTEDALLYRLMSDIIAQEAGRYELTNRVEDKDSRRIDFTRRLELMGRLSEEWRERLRGELDTILRQFPYRDGVGR